METGQRTSNLPDPAPVGFLDLSLGGVRKQVLVKWLFTTSILFAYIVALLSLYWGSQFHTLEHFHLLNIFVVDFDGLVDPYTSTTPIIGPAAVKFALSHQNSDFPTLTYQNMSPAAFNYDPMRVRAAIYDEQAWAAIIINANATALAMLAVQQTNTSYDPAGAFQLIIVSAREDTTIVSYVLPDLRIAMNLMTSKVGEMWASVVLDMAADNDTFLANLQAVPQALSPAVRFSTIDLRPFLPPGAIPTVSVGLIYLVITSSFTTAFYMPVHQLFSNTSGHPPLKKSQWVLYRWMSSIAAYFLLSLAYSLVSLAFLIPFSLPSFSHASAPPEGSGHFLGIPLQSATRYGKSSFVVFWMLNWVGMTALGLMSENVAMVVGMPWRFFWLPFWVISNVCTSFYSLTLAPGFYGWGYAWPLHNSTFHSRSVVEATRTIVFDLHSHLGLNFGVLFAWCAVNTMLFPFASMFAEWKAERQKNNQEQVKEKL